MRATAVTSPMQSSKKRGSKRAVIDDDSDDAGESLAQLAKKKSKVVDDDDDDDDDKVQTASVGRRCRACRAPFSNCFWSAKLGSRARVCAPTIGSGLLGV